MLIGLFYWFVVGGILGSFFNVCIWRIPRHESIVSPGSHCPKCQAAVKAYDNIPIISYLLLGGKCRSCREPISIEYPLVELLTALLFAATYYYYWPVSSSPLPFARSIVFLSLLVVISFIDLHFQIIPNVLSYPGLLIGLLLGLGEFAGADMLRLWATNYLLGALVGGGILLLIALAYPGGTGFGDVKLTAMLGAFLGVKAVLTAIFLAYFLGALISLILIALKIRSRRDAVPFGPFLSLGGFLSLYWGELFISWYFHNFF